MGYEIINVKDNLFSKIKYYCLGNLDEQIEQLLKHGGAQAKSYISDLVSHLICAPNYPEEELIIYLDLYTVKAVTDKWILHSAKLGRLGSTKAFDPVGSKLFKNLKASIINVTSRDWKNLYALLTFHGGEVVESFGPNNTHLISGSNRGTIYNKALLMTSNELSIVTPDFIIDCVKQKKLLSIDSYHPKQLKENEKEKDAKNLIPEVAQAESPSFEKSLSELLNINDGKLKEELHVEDSRSIALEAATAAQSIANIKSQLMNEVVPSISSTNSLLSPFPKTSLQQASSSSQIVFVRPRSIQQHQTQNQIPISQKIVQPVVVQQKIVQNVICQQHKVLNGSHIINFKNPIQLPHSSLTQNQDQTQSLLQQHEQPNQSSQKSISSHQQTKVSNQNPRSSLDVHQTKMSPSSRNIQTNHQQQLPSTLTSTVLDSLMSDSGTPVPVSAPGQSKTLQGSTGRPTLPQHKTSKRPTTPQPSVDLSPQPATQIKISPQHQNPQTTSIQQPNTSQVLQQNLRRQQTNPQHPIQSQQLNLHQTADAHIQRPVTNNQPFASQQQNRVLSQHQTLLQQSENQSMQVQQSQTPLISQTTSPGLQQPNTTVTLMPPQSPIHSPAPQMTPPPQSPQSHQQQMAHLSAQQHLRHQMQPTRQQQQQRSQQDTATSVNSPQQCMVSTQPFQQPLHQQQRMQLHQQQLQQQLQQQENPKNLSSAPQSPQIQMNSQNQQSKHNLKPIDPTDPIQVAEVLSLSSNQDSIIMRQQHIKQQQRQDGEEEEEKQQNQPQSQHQLQSPRQSPMNFVDQSPQPFQQEIAVTQLPNQLIPQRQVINTSTVQGQQIIQSHMINIQQQQHKQQIVQLQQQQQVLHQKHNVQPPKHEISTPNCPQQTVGSNGQFHIVHQTLQTQNQIQQQKVSTGNSSLQQPQLLQQTSLQNQQAFNQQIQIQQVQKPIQQYQTSVSNQIPTAVNSKQKFIISQQHFNQLSMQQQQQILQQNQQGQNVFIVNQTSVGQQQVTSAQQHSQAQPQSIQQQIIQQQIQLSPQSQQLIHAPNIIKQNVSTPIYTQKLQMKQNTQIHQQLDMEGNVIQPHSQVSTQLLTPQRVQMNSSSSSPQQQQLLINQQIINNPQRSQYINQQIQQKAPNTLVVNQQPVTQQQIIVPQQNVPAQPQQLLINNNQQTQQQHVPQIDNSSHILRPHKSLPQQTVLIQQQIHTVQASTPRSPLQTPQHQKQQIIIQSPQPQSQLQQQTNWSPRSPTNQLQPSHAPGTPTSSNAQVHHQMASASGTGQVQQQQFVRGPRPGGHWHAGMPQPQRQLIQLDDKTHAHFMTLDPIKKAELIAKLQQSKPRVMVRQQVAYQTRTGAPNVVASSLGGPPKPVGQQSGPTQHIIVQSQMPHGLTQQQQVQWVQQQGARQVLMRTGSAPGLAPISQQETQQASTHGQQIPTFNNTDSNHQQMLLQRHQLRVQHVQLQQQQQKNQQPTVQAVQGISGQLIEQQTVAQPILQSSVANNNSTSNLLSQTVVITPSSSIDNQPQLQQQNALTQTLQTPQQRNLKTKTALAHMLNSRLGNNVINTNSGIIMQTNSSGVSPQQPLQHALVATELAFQQQSQSQSIASQQLIVGSQNQNVILSSQQLEDQQQEKILSGVVGNVLTTATQNNIVEQTSASGTLRLMTQQRNAALQQTHMVGSPQHLVRSSAVPVARTPPDLLILQQQQQIIRRSILQQPQLVNNGGLPVAVTASVVPLQQQQTHLAATSNQGIQQQLILASTTNNGSQSQQISVAHAAPQSNYILPRSTSNLQLQTRPQFYGHNPNLKLPTDLFLIGCTFFIVEYDETDGDELPIWVDTIQQFGGEVEKFYCPQVTHVVCRTQRHGAVMQGLRDSKRCITAYWLSDICLKKQLLPPWQPIHLPLPSQFGYQKPLERYFITSEGFVGEEECRLTQMVEECGGIFTSYLSRLTNVLISKRPEGEKFNAAKEWNIPCVNSVWLSDICVGNLSGLTQYENQKYQQFNLTSMSFRIDYSLIPHLMAAWKSPINLTQESHERVKRYLADPHYEQKSKKEKLSYNEDVPKKILCIELERENLPKILFSQVADPTALKRAAISLGATIVEKPGEATHLVMTRESRTCKLIQAVCHVNYVLKSKWLIDSAKAGKFLPVADSYKIQYISVDKNLKFYLDIVLCSPTRSSLFSGKFFHVTPDVFPASQEVIMMIELSGGKIEPKRRSTQSIAEAHHVAPETYFIVTCPTDMYLCADLTRNGTPKCHIVSTEFVMSSILKQKLEIEPNLIPYLYNHSSVNTNTLSNKSSS